LRQGRQGHRPLSATLRSDAESHCRTLRRQTEKKPPHLRADPRRRLKAIRVRPGTRPTPSEGTIQTESAGFRAPNLCVCSITATLVDNTANQSVTYGAHLQQSRRHAYQGQRYSSTVQPSLFVYHTRRLSISTYISIDARRSRRPPSRKDRPFAKELLPRFNSA
jgi:hypothetical protein